MLILPSSPPPSNRRRRGFTLIELLVVIAIIAVLIGLLLPAVQKVRESASRTKCQNNMKQLALGMHLYQDTHKKLPSGMITDGANYPKIGSVSVSWSWATLILPYIEQKSVYDQVVGANGSVPPTAVPPNTGIAGTTKLTLYRCPSDTGLDQNANFGSYSASNYVANREVLGPGRKTGGWTQDALSVQTIKDGASNTILFGEREGEDNVGAIWLHGDATGSGATQSFEGRPGKGLNPDPRSAGKTAWAITDKQSFAYSSPHTGGVQFAMGDGRVIFITNQVAVNPNDDWVAAATPPPAGFPCFYAAGFTLQLLQCPQDKLPVSID